MKVIIHCNVCLTQVIVDILVGLWNILILLRVVKSNLGSRGNIAILGKIIVLSLTY